MKRIVALLLTALLLCSSSVFALTDPEPVRKPGHLEGYVMGDFANSDTARWIGFEASDPSVYETYNVCLSTYAAAYYNGYIYGYVYGYDDNGVLNDYFYNINVENRVILYPEGASSNGEFVYGMAYNYVNDTMYALCNENNPYIASVDLTTGELTKIVDVQLGNTLGVQTLAIDAEGNFYLLTFAAISSKLVKLDLSTGSFTQIIDTGLPCFYAQSMTYDYESGLIYWAHVNERSSSTNGLYALDLEAKTVTYLGMIGQGMEITGLLTIHDEEETPVDFLLGDANCDDQVTMADVTALIAKVMNAGDLSEQGMINADANQDGEVNILDAAAIYAIAFAN